MATSLRREFLVSFAIIITSVVVFLFGFQWLIGDLRFQSQEVANNRTLAERRSKMGEILADLRKIAPQMERYQSRIDTLLPNEEQIVFDFRPWLNSLAVSNGVRLNLGFQPKQIIDNESLIGYVPFALGLEGGYENILAFLKNLELNSPRFLTGLDKFEISKGPNGYQFSSQGRVFFREKGAAADS